MDPLRKSLLGAGILAGAWLIVRAFVGTVKANPTTFASGLSRSPGDIREISDKGHPVGVSVFQPISRQVRKQLIRYANDGGKIFLDSGAFSAFKRRQAVGYHDWEDILFSYRELINNIRPEHRKNVWVVAPDAVGSAKKTLRLHEQFGGTVATFIQGGVNVIIPAQKGKRRIAAALDDLSELYRENEWARVVMGIPYNAAAWSQKAVMQYLAGTKRPVRIHLLGAGAKKVDDLLLKVKEKGLQVEDVTSDAMFPEISLRKKRK